MTPPDLTQPQRRAMPLPPKMCLGFPEDGSCDQPVPGRWMVPPLWCDDCERKRRAHITARMQEIEEMMRS